MGSSYFGIPSMRNGKSSSSSKNNKKSSSEKPKQPQRGLGVAQLEQIRLRSQIAIGLNPPSVTQEEIMRVQGVVPYGGVPQSSISYPNYSHTSPSSSSTYGHHHPNFMLGDDTLPSDGIQFRYHHTQQMAFGEENLRYQDSQTTSALRWNSNNSSSVFDNSTFTQQDMSSRQQPTYFEDPRFDLMRSSSQNSESSDHEEVDLELRLSI